ncbi:hypothetical protein ACVBEQ_05875 [Nakamurella sp. GG22]
MIGRTRIVPVGMVTGRTLIAPVAIVIGRMGTDRVVMAIGRMRIARVVTVIEQALIGHGTRATERMQGDRRPIGRDVTVSVPTPIVRGVRATVLTRIGPDVRVSVHTATPAGTARAAKDGRRTPSVRDEMKTVRTVSGRRGTAIVPTGIGPALTGPAPIAPAPTGGVPIEAVLIEAVLIEALLIEAATKALAGTAARRTVTVGQEIGHTARDPGRPAIVPTAIAHATRTSVHPTGIVLEPIGNDRPTARTVTGLTETDRRPLRLGHSTGNHRSARSGRVATSARRAGTTAPPLMVTAPAATGLTAVQLAAMRGGSRASAGPSVTIGLNDRALSAAT